MNKDLDGLKKRCDSVTDPIEALRLVEAYWPTLTVGRREDAREMREALHDMVRRVTLSATVDSSQLYAITDGDWTDANGEGKASVVQARTPIEAIRVHSWIEAMNGDGKAASWHWKIARLIPVGEVGVDYSETSQRMDYKPPEKDEA